MKVIENNVLPFQGFLAINLFGLVFVRKAGWQRTSESRKEVVKNHEAIHTAQMREMLFIFFYLAYFAEWVIRLIQNPKTAYRSISFEKEAYDNEKNPFYLSCRRHFAQWRKNK